MTPGLPRMAPELCSDEITPKIAVWLGRLAKRDAVKRWPDYSPKRD